MDSDGLLNEQNNDVVSSVNTQVQDQSILTVTSVTVADVNEPVSARTRHRQHEKTKSCPYEFQRIINSLQSSNDQLRAALATAESQLQRPSPKFLRYTYDNNDFEQLIADFQSTVQILNAENARLRSQIEVLLEANENQTQLAQSRSININESTRVANSLDMTKHRNKTVTQQLKNNVDLTDMSNFHDSFKRFPIISSEDDVDADDDVSPDVALSTCLTKATPSISTAVQPTEMKRSPGNHQLVGGMFENTVEVENFFENVKLSLDFFQNLVTGRNNYCGDIRRANIILTMHNTSLFAENISIKRERDEWKARYLKLVKPAPPQAFTEKQQDHKPGNKRQRVEDLDTKPKAKPNNSLPKNK